MIDKNLTIKEVAERLRVSPASVRLWIKKGKLPAVLISGIGVAKKRYVVPLNELELFIAEHEAPE